MSNLKGKSKLLTLAECSIMISLATVLSMLKIFELPYGGSITVAQMLPVAIIAYRHGSRTGFSAALVSSVLQMLLGLKNFSYFTSPISFVALAVFDYVLAFGVFGIAGIFRKRIGSQSISIATGALVASLLRYACHVISGATVWAGLSIPTEAALIYSLSYNATYMIPETVILTLTALYVGSAIDFTTRIPTRKRSEKLDTGTLWLYSGAGLSMLAGLITDTVLVFSKLQDAENGELVITNITTVDLPIILAVSAVSLCMALALLLLARFRQKSKQ